MTTEKTNHLLEAIKLIADSQNNPEALKRIAVTLLRELAAANLMLGKLDDDEFAKIASESNKKLGRE